MNAPGTYRNGKRLKAHSIKDVPALSGRLIPEFDRRRNIRDMFSKKPSLSSGPSAESTPEVETVATKSVEVARDADNTEVQSATLSTSFQSTQTSESERKSFAESVVSEPDAVTTDATGPKRGIDDMYSTRPTKLSKSTTASAPSNGPRKCQKSLKGFFAPKTAVRTDDEGKSPASGNAPKRDDENATAEVDIIDPIVSKESWTRLFTKRPPPRCEAHNEPCMSLTTKKSGVNCGRAFWMCSR